jgi:hypothetical protein
VTPKPESHRPIRHALFRHRLTDAVRPSTGSKDGDAGDNQLPILPSMAGGANGQMMAHLVGQRDGLATSRRLGREPMNPRTCPTVATRARLRPRGRGRL